jgi:hypothetical protein
MTKTKERKARRDRNTNTLLGVAIRSIRMLMLLFTLGGAFSMPVRAEDDAGKLDAQWSIFDSVSGTLIRDGKTLLDIARPTQREKLGELVDRASDLGDIAESASNLLLLAQIGDCGLNARQAYLATTATQYRKKVNLIQLRAAQLQLRMRGKAESNAAMKLMKDSEALAAGLDGMHDVFVVQ